MAAGHSARELYENIAMVRGPTPNLISLGKVIVACLLALLTILKVPNGSSARANLSVSSPGALRRARELYENIAMVLLLLLLYCSQA